MKDAATDLTAEEKKLAADMISNSGHMPFHEPSYLAAMATGFKPKSQEFNRQVALNTMGHYGVDPKRITVVTNHVWSVLQNPTQNSGK